MKRVEASDILWYNAQTGDTQFWFMHDHRIVSRANAIDEQGQPIIVWPPWSTVGAGDFNRDGTGDVLWYNSQTGDTQIWFMDGPRIVSRANTVDEQGQPIIVWPPWSVVGVGDFNRDGFADILWYNSQTGDTQIWFMHDHRIVSRANTVDEQGQPMIVWPPWSVVGVGDFNRDGAGDVLWYNAETGEIQIWFMDGPRILGRANTVDEQGQPIVIGPPWSIVGAGDFNRNGIADILWYNSQTGDTHFWFMDGHRIVSRANAVDEQGQPIYIGPPWSIVGGGEARVMQEIAVRFVGFHCGVETGELSSADEPYFTFGVVPTNVEQRNTLQTRVYEAEDVDAGESVADLIELYRGLPLGAAISITLVEHDQGDPAEYRENVGRAVERTADRVVEGLAHVPIAGIPLAVLGEVVFVFALPAITDAINAIFGSGDDLIGTVGLALSPHDMTRLARTQRQDFYGIQAHLDAFISDGQAEYRAFFDVIEV